MRIQHNCELPVVPLPDDILRIERRWVCPVCGQHWFIIHRDRSMEAVRTGLSGLKNWWWQRKQARRLLNHG